MVLSQLPLLFPPGKGGAYSGNGYVLMGEVLAAVSGAATWDRLDQRVAFEGGNKDWLNSTLFMGAGRCTAHADVVHQYTVGKRPYNVGAAADSCAVHVDWYPDTTLKGRVIDTATADSAEACCARAEQDTRSQFWEFTPGLFGHGTCSLLDGVIGGSKRPGSTAGQSDGPLIWSDIVDLADYSCLNGWTMASTPCKGALDTRPLTRSAQGNIAISPKDLVHFYQALARGHLVSPASLGEMKHWLPLTTGRDPPAGTPYGLGILKQNTYYRLESQPASCERPLCVAYQGGFYLNFTGFAHPGLDWASGAAEVLFAENLNISMALAFNSYTGLNTTLTRLENKLLVGGLYSMLACSMLSTTLVTAYPSLAGPLNCSATKLESLVDINSL